MGTAADRIRADRVLAIVRTTDAASAVATAEAVLAGGIGCVEVTLTVDGALDAIRELAAAHPDAMIGAGTVIDADGARRAIDAGARFLVSPGLVEEVVTTARRAGVTVLPGAATPTEVLAALRLGADFVKVFPAAQLGGPAFVRALREPLPDAPLVPTGGVSLDDAVDYLRAGAVAVGLGGALTRGEPGEVERRARELRAAVDGMSP
jgi:2-dehydro-3-deoxyphosphogluconate aldolase / (4S)-4-hydroxy-2-oxoglutarate aldolase